MRNARCNFDGRPPSPGDSAVIRDFGETLKAREAGAAGLQWRELAGNEEAGAYWREWYCPQPGRHERFVVLRDEWLAPGADGIPVRRIYAIRNLHGSSGSPGRADSDGRAGPGPEDPLGGTEDEYAPPP